MEDAAELAALRAEVTELRRDPDRALERLDLPYKTGMRRSKSSTQPKKPPRADRAVR